MVSGGQPPPPPPPHATTHTLRHALGNLGGRQKSWIMLPSLTHPPTNSAPPTKRGRGRPRKTPVENPPPTRALDLSILSRPAYLPEHQQTFLSSLPLPNTAAHGPGIPTVLPSPALSKDVASAAAPAQVPPSWPANPDNPAVTTNVLASAHVQASRASEASLEPVGINSLPAEPVTQNPTDGQAQQMLLRPDPSPKNPVQNSRPVLRPVWYTKQACLDALQRFQSSISASPTHASDRMRMAVLRDAVDRQDWAYLFMHQCYCMLTACPAILPDDLKNLPALPYALRILHDVLQPNQALCPTVLYFCSHFPYSMQTIRVTWGPTFEHQMHLFILFVSRSSNYDQLKQICDQRRYPPLAHELAVTLGITSVTFQCLVFTAFLRYIWRSIPSNPLIKSFEAQAIAVFRQDQAFHLHPQLEPASVQSQEEIIRNQACSLQLKEIVEQYRIALQEANLPSVSPYHQQHPQSNFAFPSGPNGQMSRPPSRPVAHHLYGTGNAPLAPMNSSASPQAATTLTSLPGQSRNKSYKPLLPPSGHKQPQQRIPHPCRFSLHQANLRSPALCAPTGSSPLYTFHQGYVRPPTRLSEPGRTIETWTFNMTREDNQALCKTARQPMGAPGIRNINENSRIASLRCIRWKEGVEMPKEHVWAMTETSWIPYLYISLNDTPLQARKKLHHGKDLPIDVTDLLQEGENVLKMTVLAEPGNMSHVNYLIAIETIGVVAHESIKQQCLNQGRVSPEEVLQSIKTKLSGSGDDDEISIVESNMTIGLREPFSQAKMCDIPVRSRACLHNDCFDLDIFLRSRPRLGDASVADQWRCPICSVDARPNMLLHDGFIELVKQQLEAQGLADTRHIIVQQDGSWKPKPEATTEGTGVHEGSAAKAPTPVSARASDSRRSSTVANVEVIDISD